MRPIDKIHPGNLQAGLDALVERVNLLSRIKTSGGIRATLDNGGVMIIGAGSSGISAEEVRIAYCKTAAGTGSTIVCYLDTDTTGPEITVNCFLFESATNLNSCAPLLADGNAIPVVRIGSLWYSLLGFINTGPCA